MDPINNIQVSHDHLHKFIVTFYKYFFDKYIIDGGNINGDKFFITILNEKYYVYPKKYESFDGHMIISILEDKLKGITLTDVKKIFNYNHNIPLSIMLPVYNMIDTILFEKQIQTLNEQNKTLTDKILTIGDKLNIIMDFISTIKN